MVVQLPDCRQTVVDASAVLADYLQAYEATDETQRHERMAVLAEHLNELGEALNKSVLAYNKAVDSIEARILPAARKFKELGISSDKDLPQLEPVESVPRPTPAGE